MIGIQSDSRSGVRRHSHRSDVAGEREQRSVWFDPWLMSQLLVLAAFTMPVGMILWRGGGSTGKVGVAFQLKRGKLRQVRRRECRHRLRTNLRGIDPVQLWKFYIQLVEIEAALKALEDALGLRPIYHQLEQRIEAHIFIAFLTYCLHVTLRARLCPLAAGLTPRAVLDNLAAIQMLDVHFTTTDRRTLILSRYTEPNADQRVLLDRLSLTLPRELPPRITAAGHIAGPGLRMSWRPFNPKPRFAGLAHPRCPS